MVAKVDDEKVDVWTAVHFASGVIAGKAGISYEATIIYAIVWEIVENWNRPHGTIPLMNPESNENAVVDVLAMLAGRAMCDVIP